ncbi:hypothetical protein [Streptomyces sp. NPDC056707]|uniref:hypothetical protein n=1 Tax=Streptomyces sp. NPDC056707 TaxID=3345919 RepID=UPI00369FCA69
MDESTPWRNLGVIGLRFVDLAVRYAITFVVTLTAVEASLPADMRSMEDWLGLFVLIGVPSILISFAYGLAGTLAGAAFRGRLAGLLFLPLWFLPFLGMPLILVMGQLFFALYVMRVPLLGPSQLRRQGRVALTAVVRGISRSSP